MADLKIMQILSSKGLGDMLKVIWGIGQVKSEIATSQPQLFFVVENFRMDSQVRGAVFQWSELETSQMIGRVKLCAEWMEAPVFMQEPAILAIRKKDAPFSIPKGHLPDDKSAFLHGAHFMITKRLIETVDQITMFGQEKL